jgi:hypothetical protein
MIERHPELIVRPLDVDDVVAALQFARQVDLPVAVRGGGHGVAGHCIGDGSLVVDLRLMREVVVEPESLTATCGGGSLWEDLDTPSQRHGLATPGGTFGDTGVAGLTLGGGIGHLTPSYGLTLDNLLGATAVTADGNVVSASENENSDLFWALRGGGGNFGVVVDFTFRPIQSGSCSEATSTIASRTQQKCFPCGETSCRLLRTAWRALRRSTATVCPEKGWSTPRLPGWAIWMKGVTQSASSPTGSHL